MYLITRDGFTILAMGFTGKRAMEFKIKYIEAFNRMEEELRRRVVRSPETKETLPDLEIERERLRLEAFDLREDLKGGPGYSSQYPGQDPGRGTPGSSIPGDSRKGGEAVSRGGEGMKGRGRCPRSAPPFLGRGTARTLSGWREFRRKPACVPSGDGTGPRSGTA